jgi:hypothetical protein
MHNDRQSSLRLYMPGLVAIVVATACRNVDHPVNNDTDPVTAIRVFPADTLIAEGNIVPFQAEGRTATGESRSVTVDWSAAGGVIDVSGRFVAGHAPGTYEVVATQQGEQLADTATVTITVAGPPVLVQVLLLPASATLSPGGTRKFSTYGRLSTGDSVLVSVTYAATGGTITAAGLFTAGQIPGQFLVIASETSGALADTSRVTVLSGTDAAVFVGAGDIADCGNDNDEATAGLLDGIAGTVYTLGDNAYSSGTAAEFNTCYDPTWGRHKARTRPSPGNHDYKTSGASAYYDYFRALAGPPGRGYYSFDLGDWHIVSLNSEITMSAGSPQETWLRDDLAASTKQCTLAYWHKPRFSSGTQHGSNSSAQPLWEALYDVHADIVLGGHEHNYERFAPQAADGTADPANGIREFIVGTGGKSHYDDQGTPLPNSEVFNGTTYGVLKLTLGAGTYSWEFVPVAGGSFTDSGTGNCH